MLCYAVCFNASKQTNNGSLTRAFMYVYCHKYYMYGGITVSEDYMYRMLFSSAIGCWVYDEFNDKIAMLFISQNCDSDEISIYKNSHFSQLHFRSFTK